MDTTNLEMVFHWLKAFDDPELPDGAWWAKLENGVTFYNEDHGTNLDEHETVSEYVAEMSGENNTH